MQDTCTMASGDRFINRKTIREPWGAGARPKVDSGFFRRKTNASTWKTAPETDSTVFQTCDISGSTMH